MPALAGNYLIVGWVAPSMKRILIPAVIIASLALILWLMFVSLESEPTGRDDLAAIILRAPEGFVVQDLGVASLASAALALNRTSGGQVGTQFTDHGDTVILLVDRGDDRVVEMRASTSGTIVERHWQGKVDQRLSWAAEQGNLDTPGLPPPTGKNLYH